MFVSKTGDCRGRTVLACIAIACLTVIGCRSGGPRRNNEASKDVSAASAMAPPRVRYDLSVDGLPSDGMWKCDPKLVDLDGDGRLDLTLIPRLGHGPRVWRSLKDGSWQSMSEGLDTGETSCGGGVELADINNDGVLDLAAADHCHGGYVYLGNPDGSWTNVVAHLHPTGLIPPDGIKEDYSGAEGIDVGDVDGDGNLDLAIISNDHGGVNVYLGDGTGKNWRRSSEGILTKGAGNRVRLVDLNGDGSLDLIVAHCDGPRIWLNDGSGHWTPSWTGLPTPDVGCLYRGLDVADINEDGLLDLAIANWIDGPDVFLQQPDGSWKEARDAFPKMLGGAVGLALGDIDGDGHVDMAVSGRLRYDVGMVYGVFLLYGDGKGSWFLDENSGLPTTGLPFTWGVALGDINQDGRLDVVAGSGGNVATNPKRATRSVNSNLLVWCSESPDSNQK